MPIGARRSESGDTDVEQIGHARAAASPRPGPVRSLHPHRGSVQQLATIPAPARPRPRSRAPAPRVAARPGEARPRPPVTGVATRGSAASRTANAAPRTVGFGRDGAARSGRHTRGSPPASETVAKVIDVGDHDTVRSRTAVHRGGRPGRQEQRRRLARGRNVDVPARAPVPTYRTATETRPDGARGPERERAHSPAPPATQLAPRVRFTTWTGPILARGARPPVRPCDRGPTRRTDLRSVPPNRSSAPSRPAPMTPRRSPSGPRNVPASPRERSRETTLLWPPDRPLSARAAGRGTCPRIRGSPTTIE